MTNITDHFSGYYEISLKVQGNLNIISHDLKTYANICRRIRNHFGQFSMRYNMVNLMGYYDKINPWYYYECSMVLLYSEGPISSYRSTEGRKSLTPHYESKRSKSGQNYFSPELFGIFKIYFFFMGKNMKRRTRITNHIFKIFIFSI